MPEIHGCAHFFDSIYGFPVKRRQLFLKAVYVYPTVLMFPNEDLWSSNVSWQHHSIGQAAPSKFLSLVKRDDSDGHGLGPEQKIKDFHGLREKR